MRAKAIYCSRLATRNSRVADRSGVVCADPERAILDQIDVIYPVALKFTGDDREARLLTERTIFSALRDPDRLIRGHSGIKSAMLSLVRTTYLQTARC